MTATITPLTAVEVLATNWADNVREASRRDGNAIRAGTGNTIEGQSINTGQWMPITLRSGGIAFATAEDRDQVLAKILRL
jgi:hypothetical protein